MLTVRTPHKYPILFLAFRSKSCEEFESLIETLGLGYTFGTPEKLAESFQAVRESMPKKLLAWHRSETRSSSDIPEQAGTWCFEQGISNFFDYLYLRKPDADADFIKAWDVFQKKSVRRVVESLVMADTSTEEIPDCIKMVRSDTTPAVLDVFLREMFILSELKLKTDMDAWMSRVDSWSSVTTGQRAEYLAKSHALANPGDSMGVVTEFSQYPRLTRDQIVNLVVLGATRKIMDEMKATTPGVFDNRHEKIKTYAGIIFTGLALPGITPEKVTDIGIQAWFPERQKQLDMTELKKNDEFADGRSLAIVIKDEDKDKDPH
jgi:hypothetical protein